MRIDPLRLLDYLADAFDVLEVVAPNRRRLRVDETDPLVVVPVALSIWQREPDLPGFRTAD